jgi:CubicO group peptidase (beta-lactamase class C family)
MTYRATVVLFATLCVVVASESLEGQSAVETTAVAPQSAAPLGLWSWSMEEHNAVHSIAIERSGDDWLGTIGQDEVVVTHSRGVLSLERPNGSSFVGKLALDESEIRGYWYQPPSQEGYQYVATPAVLPAAGKARWRADITTQRRAYRVFLDVFEGESGQLSAVVRNPERNETLGATLLQLEADGDAWSLVAGSGEDAQRYGLTSVDGGGLLLEHERFDEPILLHSATDTAGYYSRQDSGQPAVPKSPPQFDDGWVVADPEEAGFDAEALRVLTEILGNVDPRNQRPQMIHSVLVAHAGQLVYEEYFLGHDRETRHDVRSLGKVFGSIMVGALQQQGHAIDADHCPIPDVLERAGQGIDDPRKEDIVLGHLLTFTSGLDCDSSSDSAGAEWRMWEQQDEPDYWLFTSQLKVLHDPGERYAYCSGSANLVGASLRAFGKAPVHELFEQLIAKPLNFGPYHFALSPNGEGYLGGGAYVLPRDILKLGAMYLAGGAWNGDQIVDEDWVEESTAPMIDISPETTGMSPSEFNNNYFGGGQAYIWSVDTVTADANIFDSYLATGNGGQQLIVIPELDLAVVFTGGNYQMGGIWGRWGNEIIGGHIIPAMKDRR